MAGVGSRPGAAVIGDAPFSQRVGIPPDARDPARRAVVRAPSATAVEEIVAPVIPSTCQGCCFLPCLTASIGWASGAPVGVERDVEPLEVGEEGGVRLDPVAEPRRLLALEHADADDGVLRPEE